MTNKIFGIGLNKTGTKTLRKCMETLGYRCYGCDRELLKDVVLRKDLKNVVSIVNQYDFFEDWPWPLIYKELDQLYPGSKFILTTRGSHRVWYNSLCKHSLRTHPFKHCRKLAYGFNYPQKYFIHHAYFYHKHKAKVLRYFAGNKNFTRLCWENGDGWNELCNFLKKPVPDVPFPHENKSSEVKIIKKWFYINKILSKIGV
jgi:hypothetical protein